VRYVLAARNAKKETLAKATSEMATNYGVLSGISRASDISPAIAVKI
jgi:hypothetical protein